MLTYVDTRQRLFGFLWRLATHCSQIDGTNCFPCSLVSQFICIRFSGAEKIYFMCHPVSNGRSCLKMPDSLLRVSVWRARSMKLSRGFGTKDEPFLLSVTYNQAIKSDRKGEGNLNATTKNTSKIIKQNAMHVCKFAFHIILPKKHCYLNLLIRKWKLSISS